MSGFVILSSGVKMLPTHTFIIYRVVDLYICSTTQLHACTEQQIEDQVNDMQRAV
jgi:hypothetical protein